MTKMIKGDLIPEDDMRYIKRMHRQTIWALKHMYRTTYTQCTNIDKAYINAALSIYE